jgi:hypothetical protein
MVRVLFQEIDGMESDEDEEYMHEEDDDDDEDEEDMHDDQDMNTGDLPTVQVLYLSA